MTKSFQSLIQEVHNKGICQECGGCVSFCSSVDYNVIGIIKDNQIPQFINQDKCLECGICYCICPQTHYLRKELDAKFKVADLNIDPSGYYEGIYSCQTTDKDLLRVGSDGGVVNSIINYMLQKKIIDGGIVSKFITPFTREAIIAKNKEDLIQSSGTTLDILPQLNEIQRFSTYTRSIPELNRYKSKKLAVVGTPCQIYTIRSMESLGVRPSENIEILLGLFCFENFLFDIDKLARLEKELKVPIKKIKKINIKEDVIFKIRNENKEKTIHLPFNILNQYIRPACKICYDFSNLYADISFGGLGSPEKFTTVITRTKKGQELFERIIDDGVLKCLNLVPTELSPLKNTINQFSRLKINRYKIEIKNLK